MMAARIDAPEKEPGLYMRREAAEAAEVFTRAVSQDAGAAVAGLGLDALRAIHTIARGSSDAAACVLWYEFMSQLGIPVTSLPPSVFSLGGGVSMDGAAALMISQSGASDDLVKSAEGARRNGGRVLAITNVEGSPVEALSDVTLRIGAGEEKAVPATKTVIGSIGAGMALLGAMAPKYQAACQSAAEAFASLQAPDPAGAEQLQAALLRARHVYVIGRGAGYGAARETALKLKETCALHAEAYSASEVLHGPLQLVTQPLTVLILDTGAPEAAASLDTAEARFRAAGAPVYRLSATDICDQPLVPAAASALLLNAIYPVILSTALALGYDPDAPANLAKVTRTI